MATEENGGPAERPSEGLALVTETGMKPVTATSQSFDSLPSDKFDFPEEEGPSVMLQEPNHDNEFDDATAAAAYDDDDEMHGRRRFSSGDFNRFMSRHEMEAPLAIRRSELPTYYRAFYTGDWQKDIKTHCYPHGWNRYCWPLLLSFLAEVFTIWGCFSCQYFKGAEIGFTGGNYGIWTLEDIYGKCQLWSVLFYSYDLGGQLRAARVFSMSAMLLGLAVMTTMAQAMQCHIISYGVGLILFVVFLVSVSTTSTFNVWIVWALFNYFLFVLIVRANFVHPVARRISRRGTKIICGVLVACHVFSILTLVVLASDFCTCGELSPGELAGRITDECHGVCTLHVSGYMVIVASALWLAAAYMTLQTGVQPEKLVVARPPELYAHYSRNSITTRALNFQMVLLSPFTNKGSDTKLNTDETGQSARDSHEDDGNSHEHVHFAETEEVVPTLSLAVNDNDEDKAFIPPRTRCQVWCCDYRVTPRSRAEKTLFWSFRCTLGFIFTLYTFLVILMIGQRAENQKAQDAPDTSPYFLMDAVCAFDPTDTGKTFQTFPNKEAATLAGWTVAHCGDCGHCSNMADIQTYVETRKTIAKSAKECGPSTFFRGYDGLVECLQKKINFSTECTLCWADNMVNTGDECLFTCIHTLFTGFMASNNVEGAGSEGWMNHCLYCDEMLSGPGFVTCSGVARRRLGIVSEIERNPEEQCKRVDVDWVNVDFETLRKNGGTRL